MEHETIEYDHEGTRLFAFARGQGRPVIFMHGGMADHRAVAFRLGGLAERHRLVMPDVRGAGRSHFSGDLSWDLLARDVGALMDHLGLATAVIGGFSAGAGAALSFARLEPARTEALVLAWPAFGGATRGLLPAQRIAMDRMHAAGRRALVEGIGAIEPLFGALPPPIREAALAMVRSFDPASVEATTRFLASGAQPFTDDDELATLGMPTLVVPGIDAEHPIEVAEAYARAIPDARTDPGADLIASIEAFLQDVASS